VDSRRETLPADLQHETRPQKTHAARNQHRDRMETGAAIVLVSAGSAGKRGKPSSVVEDGKRCEVKYIYGGSPVSR
jgi:hypothetical protein